MSDDRFGYGEIGMDTSHCADATAYAMMCKPKSITNADRLRAMSDEGLAVQIADWVSGECPSIDFCPKPRNDVTHKFECIPWKCWLDWLRQEAQDG